MRREHADRCAVSGDVRLPGVMVGRALPSDELPLSGVVRVREIQLDFLYAEAVAALNGEVKSATSLQRELHIGHDRAKQLIEDVTIGRYMIEVKVRGVGWSSAGVVLATGWHRIADILARHDAAGGVNTKKLWRAIQRVLDLKWTPPWEEKRTK